MKKPEVSMPTGRIDPTGTLANQTAAGSNAGRGGAVASPPDTQDVARRLAARSTAEIDSLMVSSAQSCGVDLRERIDWVSSYTKPDGTHVPARVVKLGWAAKAQSQDQIEAAIDKLDAALTAPTRDQVEMWLVELSVITARKVDAAETEELRVTAYASRLADYPADVVREALVVRTWKFFPTWAELQEMCEKLVAPRRAMRKALEQAAWAARDAEIKARALPTERTATLTPDEAAERKRATAEFVAKATASLRAAADAETQQNRADEEAVIARMWAARKEEAE